MKDDDPIASRVEEARTAYEGELSACKTLMQADIERREGLARKKGDLEQVRRLDEERETIDKGELISTSTPERFKIRIRKAVAAFDGALKRAAKDYVKANQDEKAAAIEAQLAAFRQSNEPRGRDGLSDDAAAALPVSESIDALAMVELPKHAVRGSWKKWNEGVSCERMQFARFMIPVAIQGGYTIRCQFTRRAGTEFVGMILPIDSQQLLVAVAAWGGTHSGFALVGGKEMPQSLGTSFVTKSSTNQIVNGEKQEMVVVVAPRKSGYTITGTLNGKPFASWTGDPSLLSTPGPTAVPCPRSPAICAWDCIADIHAVELKLERGARGYRLGDEWNCPLLEQVNEPPRDVAARCIDFKGRKYFITTEPQSFPAAQLLALQLKGRLLTISSSEENQFIAQQARGLGLWMAGWRPADRTLDWRDERNRPLRYLAHWDVNQPDTAWAGQWNLAVFTDGGKARWHDVEPHNGGLHACIEWGEE